MKKLLLSLGLFSALTASAQLAPNSVAPNFTISAHQPWLSTAGLNSDGTYTLYDYLDLGYTVILDVSATWCGPCYNYHNAHILDQLWENYGVAGQPGVSATTQDKVLVLWVDADAQTGDPTMLDGAGNIGNWLNTSATPGVMPTNGQNGNVMFPMANPGSTVANQIGNGYQIAYFPTIYRISPNRLVSEVGQLNYNSLVNSLSVSDGHQVVDGDASVINYAGETFMCDDGLPYTPSARIYNNGNTALSNIAVNFKRNGQVISTGTLASLAPFTFSTVTGSVINGFGPGDIEAEVVVSGDGVATNNIVTASISLPVDVTTSTVTVNLTTDRYASETSWEIRNVETNQVVASVAQGTFSNLTQNGQTVRPGVQVNLQPNTCYSFTIRDQYEDGICCSYGNGTFNVKDANGTTIIAYSAFGASYSRRFKTTEVLGVESALVADAISIFPNPATDRINVSFGQLEGDFAVELIDLQGRVLFSEAQVDATSTFGIATEGLSSGSYIVVIKGQGSTITKNVIVK